MQLPGTVAGSVGAASGVVGGESGADVVGDADVRMARITHAAQNVDEALRWYARAVCIWRSGPATQESLNNSRRDRSAAVIIAASNTTRDGTFCGDVVARWLASPPSRLPPARSRATADKSPLRRATSV